MNQHKIKELVETLRWNMDSLDYQPILLSMLCYRELSKKKNTILAPAQLFDAVQQLPAGDVVEALSSAYATLGVTNVRFDIPALGSTPLRQGEKLLDVMGVVAQMDGVVAGDGDTLGTVYEAMMDMFAKGTGKAGGEYYTPPSIAELQSRIVTHFAPEAKTIYDPTCGSGSLLLSVYRHAKGSPKIYGQEMNNTTYNLARMNMMIHDIDSDIQQGDTLLHPKHTGMKFDIITANPPYGVKTTKDKDERTQLLADPRFTKMDKLPPTLEFLFIDHILSHLADDGVASVVLPHGVLFRGATEGVIRQRLLDEGWITHIIGLPANMFFGTSIPVVLMVFQKNKTAQPLDIVFIDAAADFDKTGGKK